MCKDNIISKNDKRKKAFKFLKYIINPSTKHLKNSNYLYAEGNMQEDNAMPI